MRFQYALCMTCSLSMSAMAQQPAQPPGQRPAQPAAQPGITTPAPTFPTPLYRMNDISKSLNLNQDQLARLNGLTEATQARYRDDLNKLGALNEADRAVRMRELNQRYYADWNKGAGDVFNDIQRTRYQQLNYQYGGFNALYDADLQRQLNLTAEQQKNLQAHSDWNTQQLAEINRVGATDASRGAAMYRDYWTARQQRMNQFLTPQQQQAWTRMTGDPYQFQPSFTPQR